MTSARNATAFALSGMAAAGCATVVRSHRAVTHVRASASRSFRPRLARRWSCCVGPGAVNGAPQPSREDDDEPAGRRGAEAGRDDGDEYEAREERRGLSPAADGRGFGAKADGSRRSDAEDDIGPDGVHNSWRVYEREGNPCVICDGTGRNTCLYCYGDGIVYIGAGGDRDRVPCPQCEGRRMETCPRCHGSGVRPATRVDPFTLEVVPNRTNRDVINGTYPEGYPVRSWDPKPPTDPEDGDDGVGPEAADSDEETGVPAAAKSGLDAESVEEEEEVEEAEAGAGSRVEVAQEEVDLKPSSTSPQSAHR